MPKGPFTTLLKIQELQLVLEESKMLHGEDKEALGIAEKIETLSTEVPEKLLAHFTKFRKRGVGITSEVGGRCRCCNMVIPQGTLNNMTALKIDPVCPSCNVYLYLSAFKEEN